MTTFRISIPSSVKSLRPEERRAIAGALLDAARAWVEGHTLRRSLDARRIEIAAEDEKAQAPQLRRASLALPGVLR